VTEPDGTTKPSDEGRGLRDSTYSRQFVTGKGVAADPWAGIVEEHGSADVSSLVAALPDAVVRAGADASGDPVVQAVPAEVIAILTHLRDEAGYTMLTDLTAADYPEEDDRFWVVYILTRVGDGLTVRVKAGLPEENPEIESAVPIFASANWLEREVFDMFGVRFSNHPNLERILMPDDYGAHPMRKEFPVTGDIVMRD